jgi:hypothetical protein
MRIDGNSFARALPRLAIVLLAVWCTQISSGQQPAVVRMGAVDDWTHHHLIFSNPGTAMDAMQRGDYFHWVKVVNDPRFILQQAKRAAAARSGANYKWASLPSAAADRKIAASGPETLRGVAPVSEDNLRRGLSRAPASTGIVGGLGFGGGTSRLSAWPRRGGHAIHSDWSMNMGSGATSGLGMFPAKYSFDTTSANCASAAAPDFVVYNTSVTGSGTQPSVIAYDNLYSGCTGTAPTTYWAYNTGGTVATSVVLSFDGTQVAFAQSSGTGAASLVLLKWKANNGTAGATVTPAAQSPASNYRGCTAPCSLTIAFSGGANDTASSVFVDYGSDSLYVGDDSGKLHKFTGVFAGATPAEVTTGGWPVTLSTSPLAEPVFDSTSGKIFVGDYLSTSSRSNCASATTPCGFLYSVNATSAAVVKSARLDFTYGINDAPLVDSNAQMIYTFVGADSHSSSSTNPCGAPHFSSCAGVFQMPTGYASGGSGTETTVGAGFEFLMSGMADNIYFNSANAASPTGHLYVVGNTGSGNNTLYQVSITNNVMGATATAGPVLSSNFTNHIFAAGLQVTENFTGTNDYIFVSVLTYGGPSGCGTASLSNGCVMGFDVTSGTISGSTAVTGATAEAGGTSGIVIDNTASSPSGASNIYYTPLANQLCSTSATTGGCAIQISQATP